MKKVVNYMNQSAEGYAQAAWTELGPTWDRLATFEEAVRALTPFFDRAMKQETTLAARIERQRLPVDLRKVIKLAYDLAFGILHDKPSAEECVKRCLYVSPSLHAALYPSMHG